jgi:soluble lytic murein transglycosylase
MPTCDITSRPMVNNRTILCAVAGAMFALSATLWHFLGAPQTAPAPLNISAAASENAALAVLDEKDRARYGTIFAAQKQADWKTADAEMGRLNNPVLLGYVLAERYLHKDYDTSAAELADWLNIYADHPQAREIFQLAERKNADIRNMATLERKQRLSGYGDDNGLAASFGDSPHALTWYKAMKEWREGSKLDAGKQFAKLLDDERLSPWKRSAAAYWSYRSFHAAKRPELARKYLELAAEEPRSFYGILARKKLGRSLELDAQPLGLSSADIEEIHKQSATQRVVALAEIGRPELAEQELRSLFPLADRAGKERLLALAHELKLASVQIAMARQLADNARALDFARYPVPQWQPKNGFTVEPALIYALMRQESGFRVDATSTSGALGLMQIMPQTANYMKKSLYGAQQSEFLATSLSEHDPLTNLSLGQHYVEYLLGNNLVEGNLLFMLTAYNAGPKRLMDWKKSIDYRNDPLLFIESIPFAETRNYVMQVMANYWIYSELAGTPSPTANAVLSGHWPGYQAG